MPPSEKGKPAQLLGVTVVGNVEMFMYRSDVPTAPKTYDDVLANAKAQNKADFAGYIIRGKATNPVVADFLPILWSFGGDVFDENWNVVLDNDASKAAIKFLVEDLKAVAQDDPANTDAADRSQLLATGKGLQSSVWPGEINPRRQQRGDTKVVGKAEYIPIPAGPVRQGHRHDGQLDARHPEGLEEPAGRGRLHQVRMSSRTPRRPWQNKGIPSRTSVLKDASCGKANPYFPVLATPSRRRPTGGPGPTSGTPWRTIIGTHLNNALAGGETADDAATKASAEIRTLMQGAGYPTK